MLQTILTPAEASRIADSEIVRRLAQSPRLTRYTDFTPTQLCDETVAFWTFCSGSEQWGEDGGAPAALYVSVSKADGHILSREEVEKFHSLRAA